MFQALSHRYRAAMTSPCSSGSRRVESALEPTMSQNMMVSWRRSAVGVGAVDAGRERGRAAGWDASDVRLAPHLEQNLAFAELACAQLGQGRGSAAPHSSQKLLPSVRLASQLGHCIAAPPIA